MKTDSSADEEESNSLNRRDESAPVFAETQRKKKKEKPEAVEVDEDGYDADIVISEKENIDNMSKSSLLHVVKKGQDFENKTLLKATFEICAMKHNFDYQVAMFVQCASSGNGQLISKWILIMFQTLVF
ncbi:hypothetical protein Bca52824_027185 [Brassica carinata]|uniref:Uncharacterized protein n=1 Tax=Brassica carinata TaxID=52824 RepID=A0A8X7SJT6_BRACI|nr:hypothetical protein Bca52824_027185 [Brassica carinata]